MSKLRIDIVSDVVCPWCIVGYLQLEQALKKTGTTADIHWHPFELNPQMPASGQNLTEHMCGKYGLDKAQSAENRNKLVDVGQSLGFSFGYTDSSRMVNTFKAHQLLHWAGQKDLDLEHELKQALFRTYFTDQQDISNTTVLTDTAARVGLDKQEAKQILEAETYSSAVRQRESHWTRQGIQGVPAMVINEKYLMSGAQGVDNYCQMIAQLETDLQQTDLPETDLPETDPEKSATQP